MKELIKKFLNLFKDDWILIKSYDLNVNVNHNIEYIGEFDDYGLRKYRKLPVEECKIEKIFLANLELYFSEIKQEYKIEIKNRTNNIWLSTQNPIEHPYYLKIKNWVVEQNYKLKIKQNMNPKEIKIDNSIETIDELS